MAYTVTTEMPLNMPTPGTREPAAISLLNQNCVVLSPHDHTTGKGVGVGRMRSGLQANRPAFGSAGNVYFATDTGRFYADTGTAWVGFVTEGGQATVTGWTLIDPVIRDTLQFGPEGSATIDNTITRTGANALRTDSNLGVGVAPPSSPAPNPVYAAVHVGATGSLRGYTGGDADVLYLASNTYLSGANEVAMRNAPAMRVGLEGGALIVKTAPAVAAGEAQTFTTRLSVGQMVATIPCAATLATDWHIPALTIKMPGWTDGEMLTWDSNEAVNSASIYLDDTQWANGVDNARGPVIAFGTSRKFPGLPAGGRFAWACIKVNDTNPGGNPSPEMAFWMNQGSNNRQGKRMALESTGRLRLTGLTGANNILSIFTDYPTQVLHMGDSGNGTNSGVISSTASHLYINGASGIVRPLSDNSQHLGWVDTRWAQIYSNIGSINTSHISMKENFSPLDPAACVEAVLGTEWWEFDYKPPVPPDRQEGQTDEMWEALVTAHAAVVAEGAPNRHSRGYVLGSPDHRTSDLFGLADRKSGQATSDLAVVACALQSALKDIAALKEQISALSA